MFQRTPRNYRRSQPRRRVDTKRKYDTPLDELTDCLDRLEGLVELIRGLGGDQDSTQKVNMRRERVLASAFRSRRRLFEEVRKREKEEPRDKTNAEENAEARFVAMSLADEEEFVELIRRVSELVIVGEKAAAAAQARDERNREEGIEQLEDNDVEAHIALFEQFFERNALELIVNIVTGVSFASLSPGFGTYAKAFMGDEAETAPPPNKNLKGNETKPVMLPALPIATQAIQSVAILIQNVSRATSLYFLLSNNHINDLINLPLELYATAERGRRGEAPNPLQKSSSPEMSELTTHFVTFLKSLALRMNAETLQFFLTYPGERDGADQGGVPVSSAHFSSFKALPDDAEKMAVDTSDQPMDEIEANKTKPQSPVPFKPVVVKAVEVEFPLYARALQFCAYHQDSFVRVTAMNICLNTLRLATVSDEEDEAGVGRSTPDDGILDPLPIRERLAIAQHVCVPARVEGLVSPIFTRLAQLWGSLEEHIRDIDLLRERKLLSPDEGSRVRSGKMERAREETKRKKLTNGLNSVIADLQDELLLLEDVFKVGLTSLNEQMIEMMLATFVYPLLLQPLLLYMQRFSGSGSSSPRYSESLSVDVLSKDPKSMASYFEKLDAEQIEHAAPAKTALFSLTTVFHLLSNHPLLRLLFTALFHPLAPDSSGEMMIRAKPDIAGVDPNNQICVRVDVGLCDASIPIVMENSPYSFGNVTGEKRMKRSSGNSIKTKEESCVYVLSPALTEVLEGKAGDVSLIARTRSNPYRRAVIKCLSGGPGMIQLREVTVLLLDAIMSRFDSKFASDILFGTGLKTFGDDAPLDERNIDSRMAHSVHNRGIGGGSKLGFRRSLSSRSNADFTGEVVAALCISTLNVGSYFRGIWKLEFDDIAARALIAIVRGNVDSMQLASKMLEQRRGFASDYIVELPSILSNVVEKTSSPEETDDPEQRIGSFMDRMFYDAGRNRKFSTVEQLLRLKQTVGASEDDEFSVSIALSSVFDDLSSRVCSFEAMTFSDYEDAAPHYLASSSAASFLRADALSTFMKEIAATGGNAIQNMKLSGFAISRGATITNTRLSSGLNVNRSVFAPLSRELSSSILRIDDDTRESRDKDPPRPGSVVGLVGRTAIPCVCEIPDTSAVLISDDAASVLSEGVRWQSLYLVFLGRFMILAEPERGGSGGNGRIVSACSLSMLKVEKDVMTPTSTSSPARRLLVSHYAREGEPPGLFFEEKRRESTFGPFDRIRFIRSGLDVWFEDQEAADHALHVMESKVGKAKAKRGNRLREVISRHD